VHTSRPLLCNNSSADAARPAIYVGPFSTLTTGHHHSRRGFPSTRALGSPLNALSHHHARAQRLAPPSAPAGHSPRLRRELERGSGAATYDLEVSEDGGVTWTRLLTNTQQTSYQYTGQPAHTYDFRVRATDNVNNTGPWTEATTVVVQVTKYYTFAGQRIAMRSGDQVSYLYDHLGSTSLLSDASGNEIPGSRVSYFPYGETRTADLVSLPTDFGFTGQRNEGTIGLYDCRARFYDPVLGRFVRR
jgi:hypothetical protein